MGRVILSGNWREGRVSLAEFELIIFQQSMKSRRECQIYSKSDLLAAFESANNRIIGKFKDSTSTICEQGIRYLHQITHQYLLPQGDDTVIDFPAFQPPIESFTFQAPLNLQKKEIIEQENGGIQRQRREMTFNEKDQVDIDNRPEYFDRQSEKRLFVDPSHHKNRDSSTQKLKKSFKKLGLDDKFYLESDEDSDSENRENTNVSNLGNLDQGKTLAELILESNRKLEERIKHNLENRPDNSSDSSYPITDYSSNDSSNNNDYEADFKSQSQDLSSKSFNSQSQAQSYVPMKILHSPKKSKSQKKRLYIRNKKIPRWAEDIARVNEMVDSQREKGELDPNLIYGFCVVEKLDTNIIFSSCDKYLRGSSAKWTRNPYNQFIT